MTRAPGRPHARATSSWSASTSSPQSPLIAGQVISLSGFATYAASSIFFPALPELQVDLRATSSQVALVASLYELLQGELDDKPSA
jgi:hypothetical protein